MCSLAGCPVGGNSLAILLGRDQKLKQFALGFVDALAELLVVGEAAHPGGALPSSHTVNPGSHGPERILGVAGEDPQRAAVRVKLIDIVYGQTMRGEDLLR